MQTRALMTRLIPLLCLGYFLSCEKPTEPTGDTGSDTTSHHFIWDIDTIGYRNITLSDAVIINENDMWVVGEIYPDSASYWNSVQYGAAHWDGKRWTPITLPVKTLAGYILNYVPTSIIQVGENRFWLGLVQEFDGEKITKSWWIHYFYGNPNPVFEEGKNPIHLYQTPDGTVYCYGYGGSLGYYNGSSWVKIPTNTNLDIVDMHGDYNPETGEYELLALASTDLSHQYGSKLLKINNQSATEVSVDGIDDLPKYSVWFTNGGQYWVSGFDGVFAKNSLSDSSWIKQVNYPDPNRLIGDVNGWSLQDFFVLQNGENILHYNGSTWYNYKTELRLHNISFYKIKIKENNVFLLGGDNAYPLKGYIIRGRRI